MFLTVEDYRSVCDTYEFEQITEDQATRMAAEAAALEEISSYLRARYDMDRVFAASGNCRNPMVVQCAVNISLWLMVHRLPQIWAMNAGNACTTTPLNGCAMYRLPKLRPTCLSMSVRTGKQTRTTRYAQAA